MKRKSVVTRTLIRAYCVSALVLTTAIVGRTLVHVGEENCGKTSFLDTAITHGMKCMRRSSRKKVFWKKDILKKFLKRLFVTLPVIRREGYPHGVALRGNKRW